MGEHNTIGFAQFCLRPMKMKRGGETNYAMDYLRFMKKRVNGQ